MAKVDATARTIGPSGAARPAVDEAGIDALMREFFHKESSMGGLESAAETPIVTYTAAPRRDFDTAAEILERASQGFDVLINRSQLLEHNLDDASERAAGRAAEQDAASEQWKRLASGLKAQVEASEQAAAALKARCDVAEAEERVVVLEHASVQAAAHAATADQLSTKLHDKVVAAFGIGSRAHPVLEAVATRAVGGMKPVSPDPSRPR